MGNVSTSNTPNYLFNEWTTCNFHLVGVPHVGQNRAVDHFKLVQVPQRLAMRQSNFHKALLDERVCVPKEQVVRPTAEAKTTSGA